MQAIAAAVKLDGDAFRQPATALSGGMKRRLSLGIALIADPKIVVADEPTTGLDPETRRGVWNILEAERAKGRAILLTTHSMEEVRHRRQLFVCLYFWCVETDWLPRPDAKPGSGQTRGNHCSNEATPGLCAPHHRQIRYARALGSWYGALCAPLDRRHISRPSTVMVTGTYIDIRPLPAGNS